ncbi:hypothetical protein [Pseudoalteromonas sp. P1-16-1b]
MMKRNGFGLFAVREKMSDEAYEFVLAGHTTLLPPLIGLIHKALE